MTFPGGTKAGQEHGVSVGYLQSVKKVHACMMDLQSSLEKDGSQCITSYTTFSIMSGAAWMAAEENEIPVAGMQHLYHSTGVRACRLYRRVAFGVSCGLALEPGAGASSQPAVGLSLL